MASRWLLLLSLFLSLKAPAQTMADPHLVVRDRYRIQAGDQVEVVYRYTPEMNQTVTVQPDGYVILQSVGEVRLSDLTVEQATGLLTQQASVHLKDPRITLTLKELHKPHFVVAGEVRRPGRYDMDEPTTAYQALLTAGGFDVAAKLSQVVVFRRINGDRAEVHMLDLHQMKSHHDLEHDMMLQPGDMILVPKDRIAKMDRIIHATNLGLYFNPTEF